MGKITVNGSVVREGTVCELDAFCWHLRKPWAEFPEPMQQPERARERTYSEVLKIPSHHDPSGKVERTPLG